jgi:hypothetical protein
MLRFVGWVERKQNPSSSCNGLDGFREQLNPSYGIAPATLSELSRPDHLPYWHTPYAPMTLQCGANALDSAARHVKIAVK